MTSKTKKITRIGVVAALYATITLVLGSISYGPIQFRISEVMTLLPLFGKEYILSLTIGCFLANVIGPYGVPDIILGTLATFISVYAIYLTGKLIKNYKIKLLVASIWPTIFNGLIIGWMLNKLYGLPLILSIGEVALGELVVITFIGVPLFLMAGSRFKNAMMLK